MKSILTVGSVAFDSVKTPFGEVSRVVAGAATYFSIAASFFTEVRLVGVVGDDFLDDHLSVFSGRQIELDGLQRVAGETFRWRGEYSADLNTRETIYTHLNVFEGFSPRIPDRFRDTPFVFLANIHPSLQLEVLEQVEQPELVALDTMNYWIEGASEELLRVLARVDVLVINDSEARQLSGEGNLVKAARIIQGMGPERVVIKRGEYGALMTTPEGFFAVPGLPLNRVCDPTGAGDTFAGGFVGFLAAATKITDQVVNQAVIAGSAMASFTVEEFGLERLLTITDVEIKQRFRQFKRLTHFDEL
jgi:sugar/nucleoside kinase (ribokinase family)